MRIIEQKGKKLRESRAGPAAKCLDSGDMAGRIGPKKRAKKRAKVCGFCAFLVESGVFYVESE